MSASKLDAVYRSILLTKFFTKGWGKPDNLRRLFEFRKVVSNRDQCYKLIDRDYPVTITKEQNLSDCHVLEGYFLSPLEKYLPGIVPEIAQKAHFQVVLPVRWQEQSCKPVCLHLAGTGDHFFWRRRNLMVKPLLKEAGIGGIILENPFYGLRKPTDQVRSSLHNVSDIFVMGGCLILESLVLFHWCERNGLGPLGVTGLSMGGHGVMSQSINWDLLEDQYLSDGVYREKLSKMVTIVDEAFLAGKKFARTYSQHMEKDGKADTKSNTLVNSKPDEDVDVTYRESKSAYDSNVVDLTKNLVPKEKVPKKDSKCVSSEQLAKLNKELDKLLDENKINKDLYDKLMSNEKFQLESQDIADINRLTEDRVKELLLKFKVDSIQLENQVNSEKPNSEIPVNIDNNSKDVKQETIANIQTVPVNTGNNSKDVKQETIANIQTVPVNTGNNSKDVKLEAIANIQTETPKKNTIDETALVEKKPTKRPWNVSELTSDFWVNLPFRKSTVKKIDISKIHWRDREALQFMRGIMDECTHLSNFSVPFDTSLIIAVCAKHDAYVPREDVGTLEEIWPGAEVRYVDAGHVSAYILHQSLFRSCIKEAFERSKKRWQDGKHIN